jgi:hypothetical protein
LPRYDLFCGEGFVWSNAANRCALRAPDISEGEENNDPEYCGVPKPVTLPQVGTTEVLGGEVGPLWPIGIVCGGAFDSGSTLLENSTVPDFDVFEIEATAGQMLRIKGISGGVPNVAFALMPADHRRNPLEEDPPPATSKAIHRLSYGEGPGRNTERYLRILETRTYDLVVSDRDNFFRGITGGDGFDYLIELSVVPPPSDVVLTAGVPATVDLRQPPAYLVLDGFEAGSMVKVTVSDPVERYEWSSSPGDGTFFAALPALFLHVMDESGAILGIGRPTADPIGRLVPIGSVFQVMAGGSAKILLDYDVPLTALESTAFSIIAEPLEMTSLGEVTSTTPVVRSAESMTSAADERPYSMTATKTGDSVSLLRIEASNQSPAFPATIFLYNEASDLLWDAPGVLAVTLEADASFYARVAAGKESPQGALSYDLEVSIMEIEHLAEEIEPNNLPEEATPIDPIGEGLPFVVLGALDYDFAMLASDVDEYSFHLSEETTLSLTMTMTGGLGMIGDAVIVIRNLEGDQVGEINNLYGKSEAGTWTFSSGDHYLSIQTPAFQEGAIGSYVLMLEAI